MCRAGDHSIRSDERFAKMVGSASSLAPTQPTTAEANTIFQNETAIIIALVGSLDFSGSSWYFAKELMLKVRVNVAAVMNLILTLIKKD